MANLEKKYHKQFEKLKKEWDDLTSHFDRSHYDTFMKDLESMLNEMRRIKF